MVTVRRFDGWSRAACALLLLACAARELDLDKAGFTLGLLKARQYTSPLVPGTEKALGLAIVAALVGAVAFLAWRHGADLIRHVRQGSPAARCIGFGAGLLVFAKTIDGLARKLEPFGITLSRAAGRHGVVLEEVCEAWAPLFWILAIAAPVLSGRSAAVRS